MGRPDVVGAIAYALERLARELAPALVYHSLAHTRDEVLPAAERLAALSKMSAESTLLLRTAAGFHDLGYVEGHREHEAIGVRIARTELPGFGYAPRQIERVGALIMATRIPQAPRGRLAALMADADLDLLGCDNTVFLARNNALRAELAAAGQLFSDIAWYRSQADFLRKHRYFSVAARGLRDAGKALNVALLDELLAQAIARDA